MREKRGGKAKTQTRGKTDKTLTGISICLLKHSVQINVPSTGAPSTREKLYVRCSMFLFVCFFWSELRPGPCTDATSDVLTVPFSPAGRHSRGSKMLLYHTRLQTERTISGSCIGDCIDFIPPPPPPPLSVWISSSPPRV